MVRCQPRFRHGGRGSGEPTELEVGVVGADVVAGAEQPLHHKRRAHGVEQTKVLGDTTLLNGRIGEECDVRIVVLMFY